LQNNRFSKFVFRGLRSPDIPVFSGCILFLLAIILFSFAVPAISSEADEVFESLPYSSIRVNKNPQAVAVTYDSKYAYVANFNSDNLSIIDLRERIRVKDIPVGDGPSTIAIASDNSFLAVTHFFSGDVWFIDPQTNTVESGIQVGDGPNAAVLSPEDDTLYIANLMGRTISIIDTKALKLSSTIQLNDYPQDIAVSPDGKRLFVSTGEKGSMIIIDPTINKVVGNMVPGVFPRALAFSADGKLLYVGDFETGRLMVVSPRELKIVNAIKVGEGPINIDIKPDGSGALVLNRKSRTLSIVNIADGSVTEYDVGPMPGQSAIIPKTGDVLVTSSSLNEVRIIYLGTAHPSDALIGQTPTKPTEKALEDGRVPPESKESATTEPEPKSPVDEAPVSEKEHSK